MGTGARQGLKEININHEAGLKGETVTEAAETDLCSHNVYIELKMLCMAVNQVAKM